MVGGDVEKESNGAGAARSKWRNLKVFNQNETDFSTDEEISWRYAHLKADGPKVPLSEAVLRIDNSDFEAYLVDTMETYAASSTPEIQVLRFMYYLGRPLRDVQFPWLKTFDESPWPKLIDLINVPLSDMPEPVYKTSINWLNQVEDRLLSIYIYWAFGRLLSHLSALREDEFAKPTSPTPEVTVLITLAMLLRTRPNALTFLPRYPSNERMCEGLPLSVWVMAQAAQSDLSIGLYSWAHFLLPLVGNKYCGDVHQSTDLILQLVEMIFSDPNARTIFVNGAVREDGKRLVPPSSFEILMCLTFPASSARVEATSRFEAIYPLLKELALAGTPGSKEMKQLTQETFTFSLKLAGQGNPVLAEEATDIAIWSLTQNIDCCKLWDNLYEDNRQGNVALLKKLVDQWKDHAFKLSSSRSGTLTLNRTINSFRLKNKQGISKRGYYVHLYEEADKSCKVISWRLSRVRRYLKGAAITAVVVAVAGAAVAVAVSSNPELKNLLDSLLLVLYDNAIPIFITCCLLLFHIFIEMQLH